VHLPFGVAQLLFPLAFVFGPPVLLFLSWRRKAIAAGYPSFRAYARAVPQSDNERREAADMALIGLAVCMLSILFKPLVLTGSFALFYGGRKVLYALLGVAIGADADIEGS
jgi:hypothetical protein